MFFEQGSFRQLNLSYYYTVMSEKLCLLLQRLFEVDILFAAYRARGNMTAIASRVYITIQSSEITSLPIDHIEPPRGLFTVSVGLFKDPDAPLIPEGTGGAPVGYEWAHILEMIGVYWGIYHHSEARHCLGEGLRVISPMEVFPGKVLSLECFPARAVLSLFPYSRECPTRTVFAAGRRRK